MRRNHRQRRISRGWVAASLAIALSGCGGARFDGRVFESSELAFRVPPVPANWRQVDADGVLLAFRDDSSGSSIAVNGRCGKDGDDVPLPSLTHHLFINFTDRHVLSQQRISLDGRDALHTELEARLDGVRKHFTVFVLKKNGCVYDFLHVEDHSLGGTTHEQFVGFVRGFSTIRP